MITTLSSLIAILTPTLGGLLSLIIMTYRVSGRIHHVSLQIEFLVKEDARLNEKFCDLQGDVKDVSGRLQSLEHWAEMQRGRNGFKRRR